jgi:hypothetical protein
MKTWGIGCIGPKFILTSALVAGEWWASRPDSFTLDERASISPSIGDWVAPRTGLAHMQKWQFLTLPGLNSDLSIVQPVASHYTDCITAALSN